MKKLCLIVSILLLCALILCLAGCGKTETLPEVSAAPQEQPTPTPQATEEPVVTETVEYEFNYAYLSIELPEGWEYSIKEHTYGSAEPFGISFRPEGKSGSVDLFCHPNFEGICGTGLADRGLVFSSGHTARMRTYEASGEFSHITFSDTASTYRVELGGNAHSWWKEYEEEILQILDTAKVGKPCVTVEEALAIAEPYCTAEYGDKYGSFDFENGLWEVYFNAIGGETREFFYVTAEGELWEDLSTEEVIAAVGNDCQWDHETLNVDCYQWGNQWEVTFWEEGGYVQDRHYVSRRGILLK